MGLRPISIIVGLPYTHELQEMFDCCAIHSRWWRLLKIEISLKKKNIEKKEKRKKKKTSREKRKKKKGGTATTTAERHRISLVRYNTSTGSEKGNFIIKYSRITFHMPREDMV